MYIRKTEFESLKNTAGAGILNVSDIAVFKNEDNCSNTMKGLATPLVSSVTTWGLGYVYTTQVNNFSSFYFASKNYSTLPVAYSNIIELSRGNSISLQVQVTPNPVTGAEIVFRINLPKQQVLPVSIYDIAGRLIPQEQVAVGKGMQLKSMRIGQLPSGVYQAVVDNGRERQVMRFVRR